MTVDLQLLDSPDGDGRPRFRLLADYRYRLGPRCSIIVPEGYVTNLGTVPRWAEWFVSGASLREAAIVHDWLCNECVGDYPSESGFSRWFADAVLYEALARMGFVWYRRFTVWAAVRLAAIWKGNNTWPTRPEGMEVVDVVD